MRDAYCCIQMVLAARACGQANLRLVAAPEILDDTSDLSLRPWWNPLPDVCTLECPDANVQVSMSTICMYMSTYGCRCMCMYICMYLLDLQ